MYTLVRARQPTNKLIPISNNVGALHDIIKSRRQELMFQVTKCEAITKPHFHTLGRDTPTEYCLTENLPVIGKHYVDIWIFDYR